VRILKSIRRAQLSFLPRRTYYYCIYIARIYIESFRAKRAPTNVYFSSDHGYSQLLFRIHIIIRVYNGSARSEFISCVFFFFTIVLIEKCLHIIIIVCVLYVVFLAIYNNIIYKYAFGEKSPSTFVMPHRVVMCVVRVRRGLYYYNIQYENKIYRLVLDAAAYLLVYDIMINLLKFN
jgi:hypothetical protein